MYKVVHPFKKILPSLAMNIVTLASCFDFPGKGNLESP